LTRKTQGTSVITWTFSDGNGNSTTATQNIIVKETTAPVTPTLADATGECSATAVAPTTTDACAGTITGTTTDALTRSTQGTSIITWTFSDGNGNSTTATQNIIVKDTTKPIIASLPTATTINCPSIPIFTTATATDNCNFILQFEDKTTNRQCAGSYSVTRTWTATDDSGNFSTASQTINVQDTTGPTTITPFSSTLDVSCDAIPARPELVFVDNCSTVVLSPPIPDNYINRTQDSYSIVRKWSVSDACGNISTFTQIVNVSVPNSVVALTSSSCNNGDITSVNLTNLLPSNTPKDGTWIDVNNSGALQRDVLTVLGLATGDYIFEYKIDHATCPRTIRINMTINADCAGFVLPCGTIVVHNAFSPNGDGINENFIIDNITDTNCYPTNSVEIYNRWGVLVFETTGYDNVSKVFNGTSEGRMTIGQSFGLPTGTYFYILNYTSYNGSNAIQYNKKDGYLYLTR
jgi:gliding motility-associated-like protein